MDKNPTPFLLHIRDSINRIASYVQGSTFEQFRSDNKTQDAVIRQLEIIGEAAANLESEFQESYPDIPWREITDFRNVLAHEYWDIDIKIVWEAATKEVPELGNVLIPIIEDLQ